MLTSAEYTTVGPSHVSSLTFVVKSTEVDPSVPGIRDESPFPRAEQCSPIVSSSLRSVRNYCVCREHLSSLFIYSFFFHSILEQRSSSGESKVKYNYTVAMVLKIALLLCWSIVWLKYVKLLLYIC